MRSRWLLLAIVWISACPLPAHLGRPTPVSPWIPWRPSEGLAPQAMKGPGLILPPSIPRERLALEQPLSLADVVAIAVRNHPATQAAWREAEVAAGQLSLQQAELFPRVDGNVRALTQQQAALGGQFKYEQTIASPGLVLAWDVVDFARSSRIDAAARALVAANFDHARTLQDVVLQVETAYFQALDARALAVVQHASMKTAETSLDAARARLEAGLATRADVLQAQTALSQTRLFLEQATGQVDTTRGALATAMGLPATATVNVGELPSEVPAHTLDEAVDSYLAIATAKRPDLLAARARAEQAGEEYGVARSNWIPTLSVDGSLDRTWFLHDLSNTQAATNYSVGVTANVPIVTGLVSVLDVKRADAARQAFAARAANVERQVALDVWTSYFVLRTRVRQLEAARDLLASARESLDVAAGRYQAGVGDILDLLTAQSSLATAQATEVQARTAWFLSVARLTYATGELEGPAEGSTP